MYKLSNPRKSCRSGLSSLNVNKIPLQGSSLLTPCICPKEVIFSPIFAVSSTWNNLPQFASFASGSLPNWNFSSVAQYCPTLCNPMNRSTPGLPVHHQLPEFTQTHVHWVSDAIQPSHPLSSPSPPAPNPSQHQSLFQWVNSSREVAKVLEFQL